MDFNYKSSKNRHNDEKLTNDNNSDKKTEEFSQLLRKFKSVVHNFITEFIESQLYDSTRSSIPKNYNLKLKIKLLNHILLKFDCGTRKQLEEEVLSTVCHLICLQRRVNISSNDCYNVTASSPLDILWTCREDNLKNLEILTEKLQCQYQQKFNRGAYDEMNYSDPSHKNVQVLRSKSPRVRPDMHYQNVVSQIFQQPLVNSQIVYQAESPTGGRTLRKTILYQSETNLKDNHCPCSSSGLNEFANPEERKMMESRIAAQLKSCNSFQLRPFRVSSYSKMNEIAAIQNFEDSLLSYIMLSKCVPLLWCGKGPDDELLLYPLGRNCSGDCSCGMLPSCYCSVGHMSQLKPLQKDALKSCGINYQCSGDAEMSSFKIKHTHPAHRSTLRRDNQENLPRRTQKIFDKSQESESAFSDDPAQQSRHRDKKERVKNDREPARKIAGITISDFPDSSQDQNVQLREPNQGKFRDLQNDARDKKTRKDKEFVRFKDQKNGRDGYKNEEKSSRHTKLVPQIKSMDKPVKFEQQSITNKNNADNSGSKLRQDKLGQQQAFKYADKSHDYRNDNPSNSKSTQASKRGNRIDGVDSEEESISRQNNPKSIETNFQEKSTNASESSSENRKPLKDTRNVRIRQIHVDLEKSIIRQNQPNRQQGPPSHDMSHNTQNQNASQKVVPSTHVDRSHHTTGTSSKSKQRNKLNRPLSSSDESKSSFSQKKTVKQSTTSDQDSFTNDEGYDDHFANLNSKVQIGMKSISQAVKNTKQSKGVGTENLITNPRSRVQGDHPLLKGTLTDNRRSRRTYQNESHTDNSASTRDQQDTSDNHKIPKENLDKFTAVNFSGRRSNRYNNNNKHFESDKQPRHKSKGNPQRLVQKKMTTIFDKRWKHPDGRRGQGTNKFRDQLLPPLYKHKSSDTGTNRPTTRSASKVSTHLPKISPNGKSPQQQYHFGVLERGLHPDMEDNVESSRHVDQSETFLSNVRDNQSLSGHNSRNQIGRVRAKYLESFQRKRTSSFFDDEPELPINLKNPQEIFFWVPLGRYSWEIRRIKACKSKVLNSRETLGSKQFMGVIPERIKRYIQPVTPSSDIETDGDDPCSK